MFDLEACMVCLSLNVKLLNMDTGKGQLRRDFNTISGLTTKQSDGMPKYLCLHCHTIVQNFKKFREKCHRAHYTLQELLRRNKQINKSKIEALDRKAIGIMPALSYMDINKMHYEVVKFQWTKYNRHSIINGDIPIAHYSTIENEGMFQVPKKRAKFSDTQNDNVKEEVDQDRLNSNDHNYQNYTDQSTSNVNSETLNIDSFFNNDDNFESDQNDDEIEDDHENETDKSKAKVKKKKCNDADGSNLDEEYANMIPIPLNEAKAAGDIYKMFSNGKYRCDVCCKGYQAEWRLKVHQRMHDKYVSGTFCCEICNYHYKTEFLLTTHMTEKHMYKYVCKKCSEVNFDRVSAKQHYIWAHLQKGSKKDANWYETKPSWIGKRGGKRVKRVVTLRPVKKAKKLPDDFLVYSPVPQKEQYSLVQDRRLSRNYKEAEFKCELCFRGFRESTTYNKHMRKHNPTVSGNYQCDMCKLYFQHPRKLYKHMIITHLSKYSCRSCDYVCYNRGQATLHYRWHKNVTYQCPHCDKEFKKASTQLTHIRIKHPSTYICDLCGHSFVSEIGLFYHKNIAHSKEEMEAIESAGAAPEPELYCGECAVQFRSEAAFATHLGSSNKHAVVNVSTAKPKSARNAPGGERKRRGRPRRRGASEILNNGVATSTRCEVCNEYLNNDVQARKHYESEHPGTEFLKRYMCDVCGHVTKQYANLMVHMRTHTREKPYACPHCERRFSMPSNRDRHLVVHTGEKRYQCQHCNRRFTQSSAVKLHIQTVHLKIPYAPWDKKNRKRRKELEGTAGPITALAPSVLPPQQHKLILEPQGEYLNAFVTYNDE